MNQLGYYGDGDNKKCLAQLTHKVPRSGIEDLCVIYVFNVVQQKTRRQAGYETSYAGTFIVLVPGIAHTHILLRHPLCVSATIGRSIC